MNLFYESHENRKHCCRVRKVLPMRRYLTNFDAYITGLRRDQNANRADARKIEVDSANGDLVWAVKDGSADGVRNALKEGAEVNGVGARARPTWWQCVQLSGLSPSHWSK